MYNYILYPKKHKRKYFLNMGENEEAKEEPKKMAWVESSVEKCE